MDNCKITGNLTQTVIKGNLPELLITEVPIISFRKTGKLNKTGIVDPIRTGDDGDLQKGKLLNWTQLDSGELNPFGNSNRFTDEDGSQSYTNNIMLDWSTYDGSEVLGVHIDFGSFIVWDDAIDDALALNVGGFTGWRMANLTELSNFTLRRTLQVFNYDPLYSLDQFWSSTPYVFASIAWAISAAGVVNATLKTAGSRKLFAVKDFTLAELGLS